MTWPDTSGIQSICWSTWGETVPVKANIIFLVGGVKMFQTVRDILCIHEFSTLAGKLIPLELVIIYICIYGIGWATNEYPNML